MTSVYTNIFHDLDMKAIERWLTKYPELMHKRFSKELLLETIKSYLKRIISISMTTCMYNQVPGNAMATKFAPTYATLVLAYLEEFDKE